jgi:hypothetical protein
MENVKLELKEYKFNPKPKTLRVMWSTMSEIVMSDRLVEQVADAAAREMRHALYVQQLDNFLKFFDEQEKRRLDRTAQFMKQVGARYAR